MNLNLGCGNKKIQGWINVDSSSALTPDIVHDLESFPWPWADSSIDNILLAHVLEHLGKDSPTYLKIFTELYRISKNNTKITIAVPHPRHNDFLNDPTHVRPITYEGLILFDQQFNRRCIDKNWSNTLLGMQLGIDISVETVEYRLDERWQRRLDKKEITEEELNEAALSYNNVVREALFTLRVRKPLLTT